jgi:hypothetical protein
MYRSLLTISAVAGLGLFCASSARADVPFADASVLSTGDLVSLSSYLGNANGGGQFLVTDVTHASQFIVNCIETSEEFSLGNQYQVILSNSAVLGEQWNTPGVGLDTGPDENGNGSSHTPVALPTQWLYQQWALGNLGTALEVPTFTYTGGTAAASADSLQLAIWALQGQIDPTSISGDALATALVAAATTTGAAGPSAADKALGTVLAMQMWGSVNTSGVTPIGTNPTQDQIVYLPASNPSAGTTPEPASIVAWSGLLVLGAVASLRKRAAKAS